MMTYDERQEILDYLQILEKNMGRTMRNLESLKAAIEKATCVSSEKGESYDAQ